MGANWSVTFVSKDGEEMEVPIDVLSAASPVWRERLKLAGGYPEKCRSEECCDVNGIRAFVNLISHGSQDAERVNEYVGLVGPLNTMLDAMPLIHKYDCKGTLMVLSKREEAHFPPLTASCDMKPGGGAYRGGKVNLRSYGRSENNIFVAPAWLTQAHFNYILRKQELYGVEGITTTMKQLLAYALGSCLIKEVRGASYTENEVQVNTKKSTSTSKYWLVLDAWRLDQSTLLSLFAHTHPEPL